MYAEPVTVGVGVLLGVCDDVNVTEGVGVGVLDGGVHSVLQGNARGGVAHQLGYQMAGGKGFMSLHQ